MPKILLEQNEEKQNSNLYLPIKYQIKLKKQPLFLLFFFEKKNEIN